MFDSLSDRLGGVFDKLRGRGALSEADVRSAMREVRVALLEADVALLNRTGASVDRLSGCCGLAGNFGVERGHYEVSVAVAESAASSAASCA